jgi:phosphoenolpyruvate-protein phosphotransferase
MPSDTVRLDKDFVLGFCTAEGGPTSHTAILSKALGLPAVVGVGHEILNIDRQAILVIDGGSGDVIINPDKSTLKSVQKKRKAAMHIAKLDLKKAHKPAATQDGVTVEVVANIGNPDDAVIALEDGAEGVGLLRTEFLYLDRKTAPNETEQLKAYKSILDIMGTRPVIIRTLDVGGDKELPYLNLGREANPFLGWRAIRMCLDKPDFFKVQLRALLRASPGHDLRIMFPMIATLEEVRKAQNLLNQARDEVTSAGYPIAENIQVGIMVEIPSTVILADLFAREVDFFSIGTNDLTQYTMAAERTNDRVAYLGDACHPAVLREIQTVIKAAHSAGIWVGLCGELAGDPEAIPILLGLGLDEFSMAPPLIPHAKAIIRNCSMDKARQLASKVVDLATAAEVRQHARSYISGDDVR